MPSSHLILCHPLLLLPPILPSINVFSNESALRIRWPKHLEFQLQHQSFQWTPRTDLLQDGLVGSPPSPRDSQESSPTPQFRSINSLAQLSSPCNSHIHMSTGKTIALTRWTFIGKVMSLLLNMLSRLVITFFPKSKHLLISWLQSPSLFPHLLPMKWWDWMPWSQFSKCWALSQLFHSPPSLSSVVACKWSRQ